jgi:hypothetical protein
MSSECLILTGVILVVGMAAVKLALLHQEAEEIQQGTAIALDETVSHSVLILTGLELEDQQYVIQQCFECIGFNHLQTAITQ